MPDQRRNIGRIERIARPYIVMYQDAKKCWKSFRYATQQDADKKAASLIHNRTTQRCLVARIEYAATKIKDT